MNKPKQANQLEEEPVENPEDSEQVAAPEEERALPAEESPRQYTYSELERTLIPNNTRSREARVLAEDMGKTVLPLATENGQSDMEQVRSNLVDYFVGHPRCLQFIEGEDDQEKAEKLAAEILDLEQTLIAQFIDQVRVAHPETDEKMNEKIEKGIISVRECFYRLVMGGSLSSGKIHELIGEVKFLPEPKTETGEELIRKSEIVGYYKQENGRFVMYFYDSLLDIPTADGRLHAASHEMAHIVAEGSNLFSDADYVAFIELARQPNPQISQTFRDRSPQLASIIDMLNDPISQQHLWTAYLRKLFDKLNATEEGDQKAKMREIIAREMVAETVGSYFEADQNEEALLTRRLKYAKGRIKDGVANYLRTASGCETADDFAAFCRQKNILFNPEGNYTPQELIALLSQVDEFKNLFRANGAWAKNLRERFAGRGAKIQSLGELREGEMYDYYDGDDYLDSYTPDQMTMPKVPKEENSLLTFEGIWDFLTLGRKPKDQGQETNLKQAA